MLQTKAFGYYYPETEGTVFPLDEDAKEKLRTEITALYPTPARLLVLSKKGNSVAEEALKPKAKIVKSVLPISKPSDSTPSTDSPTTGSEVAIPGRRLKDLVSPTNTYTEWLVNIISEKHALDGDYSVMVFLGPPPEDDPPRLWHLSPLYVGAFYPFGQKSGTGCANCRVAQRDHMKVTGQIPLTLALMERYLVGVIPDLSHAEVVKYLSVNLHWRVRKVRQYFHPFHLFILSHSLIFFLSSPRSLCSIHSEELMLRLSIQNGAKIDDRSSVDGLKVFVVTNEVTLPQHENELPTYEYDVTPVLEITTKLGGEGGRGEGTGLTRMDLLPASGETAA
jgi:tyrosinase